MYHTHWMSSFYIRFLLIAFLAIVTPLSAPAQTAFPDPANWQLERVSVADYLGSKSINSIAEDHQGFLWLATNTGIARYDGYTFKNYMAIPGDSTTLNHSRPGFAYIDHQGTLWVGTRAGINRYLPACDCFKQYNAADAAPNTVPGGSVNWITEDRNNRLWVADHYGGLYRYDRAGDRFERFLYRPEDPVNLSGDPVQVLLCDQEGWIWAGTGETSVSAATGGGLIRFNPETGKAIRYLHDPEDEYSLLDDRVSALLQDSEGRIWVGSCGSGLHRYDPEKGRFIRMMPGGPGSPAIYAKPGRPGPWTSCSHIRVLHEDEGGGIWVGNYNGGLYRFDPSEGAPLLFDYEPGNPDGLINNLFRAFLEDSQGRFWLGNVVGGLFKIDPWKKKFKVHFPQKVISAVFEAPSEPDVIWVAVWDEGAYRWDLKTGERRHFQHSAPASGGPASNRIKGFFEDGSQGLWLAHDKGLSLCDRKTGQFTHFPVGVDEKDNKESASVYVIHEDAEGHFWLGTWGNGLYQFDKRTGSCQQYTLPLIGGQEHNKFNQSIYAIHEDAQGRLWLGTWMEGLYLFDRRTGRFTHYLEGIGIRTIFEREPGKFWLGTGDHGLIEFAPETGMLRLYTTQDGLPGNKVYTLLEGQDKVLWMSTNYGICSFGPETEAFTNYGKSDGLPSYQFMDFSALKASDGAFYFGSVEGLVSFRPEQAIGNPTPPALHILDVLIFDKSCRKGEVDSSNNRLSGLPERLELRYNQNELTFEYVGLHYTAPELNQYRRRLIPYEQHWVEAGNKRTARYTNLSPGDYQFQVIASNSDGLWAETPATINIRIRPPWWATWWAYLLYVLTTSSALYSAYRFQKRRWELQASLQRELEKSQRLKELDEFKSRFYANITHEFRTPLTIIQGLAGQIRDNPRWKVAEHTNLIQQNSQKLLHLINQLLGLSKLEAGKMEPEFVQGDIIKYLSCVVESYHSLAINRNISLSFYAPAESLIMDYDPEKCQQILSNLISNAIRFTPEYGKIKVVAKEVEEGGARWLEVRVQDTGAGIPPEKLPYIFDRFFQVQAQAPSQPPPTGEAYANSLPLGRSEGAGAGLGLALAKELTGLMGGTITVESKVGEGSCFSFHLPIHNEAEMEVMGQQPNPVAPLTKRNARLDTSNPETGAVREAPSLLVVEDNLDVIYYLRECLAGRYQVLEARNGREGMAKALETIPDLVVSDVMMPEMDGFEFCKALKTDERTSHIPVILLTAKATQEDKLEGLSHGADAYLMKPFHKEELLVRLEQLLELRRRLQQKYQSADGAGPEPEDAFLRKIREIIEAHLDEPDLSVEQLGRKAGMSRVQLHRKMKALTGMPASHYIRMIRLTKAFELLKDSELNISEVAYRVGFKDPSYFSRLFSQYFGVAPKKMRR